MSYIFTGTRPRGRKRTSLGDDSTTWVDAVTGAPVTVAWDVPTDVAPAWNLPGSGIPYSSLPSGILNITPTLPNVSPSTLLQAAKLSNAPTVVKQAAAQYAAANPVSSWLSGQMIAGIPNYFLLGGGALAVVLLASAGGGGRRGRR